MTQIIGKPAGMSDTDWIKLGDALYKICEESYAAYLNAKDKPAASDADMSLNWCLEKLALWLVASEQEFGMELSMDDALEEAWITTRSRFDESLDGMVDYGRKHRPGA